MDLRKIFEDSFDDKNHKVLIINTLSIFDFSQMFLYKQTYKKNKKSRTQARKRCRTQNKRRQPRMELQLRTFHSHHRMHQNQMRKICRSNKLKRSSYGLCHEDLFSSLSNKYSSLIVIIFWSVFNTLHEFFPSGENFYL